MNGLSILLAATLTTIALSPIVTFGQGQADLVLAHGKIWTENPKQPEVEAVAIQGNRIVAVGDSESILKLAGPKTKASWTPTTGGYAGFASFFWAIGTKPKRSFRMHS